MLLKKAGATAASPTAAPKKDSSEAWGLVRFISAGSRLFSHHCL